MFRAGATHYSVWVKDRPIVLDGDECLGLCDGENREIFISPRVLPDKRLPILIHELTHAWIFEVGEPSDAEGICDFCSTVATACIRDLAIMGGEEALKRLRPGESITSTKNRIGLCRARICECNGLIAPGEIQCVRDENAVDMLVFRMFCEHCNQTTIWKERMTFGGDPSGEMVGEAYRVKGNKLLQSLPRELQCLPLEDQFSDGA